MAARAERADLPGDELLSSEGDAVPGRPSLHHAELAGICQLEELG